MAQIPVITTSKKRLRDSLSLEERAKAILARPNALTSMGMINPRVVNKQEAGIISDYRASRSPGASTQQGPVAPPTPFQARKALTGPQGLLNMASGLGEVSEYWQEEAAKPFFGTVSAPFSPSVREQYRLAREQGESRRKALGTAWDEGLTDTPWGVKGAAELILDPINLVPVLGFPGAVGKGIKGSVALTKATGAATVRQLADTPVPRVLSPQRSYFMPPEGTPGGGMGAGKTEQFRQDMAKMTDFVEGRSRFDDPVLNKELDDASKKIADEAERLRATTPPEPTITTGPTGKPITQAQGPAVPISPWAAKVGDILNHPHLGEVVVENADDPAILVIRSTSPDATAGTMTAKIGRHTFDDIGVEKTADDLARDAEDALRRSDLTSKMADILLSAKKLYPRAAAAISRERAKKLGQVGEERASPVEGPEARAKAFGAMKGEIARPEFEFIKPFTDEELELAQDMITQRYKHQPTYWLQTQIAFEKLFVKKQALTPREAGLLDRVFGTAVGSAGLKGKTGWQRAKSIAIESWNIPKAIKSSIDLSAPLRQGSTLLPEGGSSKKALREMFRSFTKESNYQDVVASIIDDPVYPEAIEHGLDLTIYRTGVGRAEEFIDLAGVEEAFIGGRAAEMVLGPYLGGLIRVSNRAYVAFLNKLRIDVYKKWRKEANRIAIKQGREGASEDELKGITRSINILSGRGELGRFTDAAMLLNLPFFSPRFAISRFQLPVAVIGAGSDATRKAVLRNVMSYMAFMTTALGVAEAAGVGTIEKNPRSADFGKLRIGNTRIDPWAGFQQVAVFLTQMSPMGRKSTATGEIENVDPRQRVAQFMESKLSPPASVLMSLGRGRRMFGKELTAQGLLWEDLIEPMSIGDVDEAVEDIGWLAGGAAGTTSIFGTGLTTYGMPDWKDDFKEYISIPRDTNLLELGQTSRLKYRKANPEVDAKLFISGAVSSLQTGLAVSIAVSLIRDNNINIDDITGVQDRKKEIEESKSFVTPRLVDDFIRQAETQLESAQPTTTGPTPTAPLPGGTNRPITPPISELLR